MRKSGFDGLHPATGPSLRNEVKSVTGSGENSSGLDAAETKDMPLVTEMQGGDAKLTESVSCGKYCC